MTEPVVIRATDLGKRYARIHETPMLLRDMALMFSSRRRIDEFWALRHVSFDVHRAETFGILGPNGSGKSTLLTLLAGTSFPSEGVASTRGRISLLLELGAGFSIEMTGEENIIVNAGLLGLSTAEAGKQMQHIVEFAELEHVIDTPIRHYSSGMLARLGFSIAIHVSPDILIVDEVLAVGDIAFQQKCMTELQRLQQDGTTIVLVSQAPGSIANLCNTALWLKDGHVQSVGPAAEIASQYEAAMHAAAMRAQPTVASSLNAQSSALFEAR
jgi:lipopolysaccharide transport system ATP-binding protein